MENLRAVLLKRKDLLQSVVGERALKFQAKKAQLQDHNLQVGWARGRELGLRLMTSWGWRAGGRAGGLTGARSGGQKEAGAGASLLGAVWCAPASRRSTPLPTRHMRPRSLLPSLPPTHTHTAPPNAHSRTHARPLRPHTYPSATASQHTHLDSCVSRPWFL